MKYDFIRVVGTESGIVGRIIHGRQIAFYSIHIDNTFNGRDWCRNHGMRLVCRVPNTDYTAWYEIWENHNRRLMTAFLI